MVKPAGTGMPRFAISARLAPLLPRRFFMSARPSALPPPKEYTSFVVACLTTFTLPIRRRAPPALGPRGTRPRRPNNSLSRKPGHVGQAQEQLLDARQQR